VVWTFAGVVAVPEFVDQLATPASDPRLDGSEREVERQRDLGVVEVADVAHYDSGPKFLREFGERSVDRDAVDDTVEVAMGELVGRLTIREVVVVDHDAQLGSALALAQLVERRVGRDAIHPGGERGATIEAIEIADYANHGFLGRVVGVACGAGDPTAYGVDAVVVTTQQLVHRVRVAANGGADEFIVGRDCGAHGW
jgi:hypothetical protein